MAYDLLAYFIYMAVSNTFIPLPTPPAVLAAGVVLGPFMAALIGGVANLIGATVDYWLGSKIPAGNPSSKRYQQIQPFLEKFKENAFIAIVIAGFTPFFFDPLRFGAGYVGYDIKKYWLAVFLGRAPRFYILALLGKDLWHIIAETLL